MVSNGSRRWGHRFGRGVALGCRVSRGAAGGGRRGLLLLDRVCPVGEVFRGSSPSLLLAGGRGSVRGQGGGTGPKLLGAVAGRGSREPKNPTRQAGRRLGVRKNEGRPDGPQLGVRIGKWPQACRGCRTRRAKKEAPGRTGPSGGWAGASVSSGFSPSTCPDRVLDLPTPQPYPSLILLLYSPSLHKSGRPRSILLRAGARAPEPSLLPSFSGSRPLSAGGRISSFRQGRGSGGAAEGGEGADLPPPPLRAIELSHQTHTLPRLPIAPRPPRRPSSFLSSLLDRRVRFDAVFW
jgi:hypothetical protein